MVLFSNLSFSNTRLTFGLVLLSFGSAVLCATSGHAHKSDHLLTVLSAMHNSSTFHSLPANEQVFLVEILAAAEVNQITHFIDRVGFAQLALFLDHVSKINQTEAHMLEHYLMQELNQEAIMTGHSRQTRTLQDQINNLMKGHMYQSLSPQDQKVLVDLFVASQHNNVTQYIDQTGYATIMGLVEHLSSPDDTHRFLQFLVKHLEAESAGHSNQILG